MTGYRVVFDREKLVLGWKKFDCKCCSRLCIFFFHVFIHNLLNHPLATYAGYDIEDYNTSPIKPHSITVSPAVAAGLGNYSTPKSTKETTNSSKSSVAWPSLYSHTSPLTFCFRFIVILFLLL